MYINVIIKVSHVIFHFHATMFTNITLQMLLGMLGVSLSFSHHSLQDSQYIL